MPWAAHHEISLSTRELPPPLAYGNNRGNVMINAIDAQIRDAIRTWARDIDLKLVQKPL